jgi:hypothetical protein
LSWVQRINKLSSTNGHEGTFAPAVRVNPSGEQSLSHPAFPAERYRFVFDGIERCQAEHLFKCRRLSNEQRGWQRLLHRSSPR